MDDKEKEKQEKLKSRKEGLILMLKSQLEKLSSNGNIKNSIKEYFLVESSYTSLIKESKLEKEISKYTLNSILSESYFETSDKDIFTKRRNFEKLVKNLFYSYILSPKFDHLIDKIFADEGETSFDINKTSIVKGVHKSLYDLTLKTISNSTMVNTIPNFLLFYDKKIIDTKINEILKYKYNFNYSDKNKNSIEFKYLENLMAVFIKDKKNIFDLFNVDLKYKIFRLIIYCNFIYIKRNSFFLQKFMDKFGKYINTFKLDNEKHQELLNEFNEIFKVKTGDIINEKLTTLFEEIKKELFSQKEKNIDDKNKLSGNNVIIVHDDKNQELIQLNKKYLQLIFGISLLFNNIINVEKNTNENKEIIFNTKLNDKIICSATERQFLINFLKLFEKEKSFIYNYLLETFTYENIFKSYNKQLYIKNREFEKEILNTDFIISLLKQYPNFNEFHKNNSDIFEQNKVENGFFGKLINKKTPDVIHTKKGKIINYTICNLKLIPIIRHNISSTQITILIDGSISNNMVLISDEKNISHKEIFNTFFTNNKYTNSDFYCYEWQAINYKNNKDLKTVAKFYGKLLAYILNSRKIFKFQTINLIARSMGGTVIKHCLLEMNNISKNSDIINDVFFIGASNSINLNKHPDIFNNVCGRIINIFSNSDKKLENYNKNAVGLEELRGKRNRAYSKLSQGGENASKTNIINIDLSKKNVQQEEYIFEIPRIFINDVHIL